MRHHLTAEGEGAAGRLGDESSRPGPRVAEFFAGIGLMRAGLEAGGFQVVWANDIESAKQRLYLQQYKGDSEGHFLLQDVRAVHERDLPSNLSLATASFPCTDLSLAGDRAGLRGAESSMFWEFERVLRELDEAKQLPPLTLLENVTGFATSHGGADLAAAVAALNARGYVCDILAVDAVLFVPQSRPRMFIVGALDPHWEDVGWEPTQARPGWIGRFVRAHPELKLCARHLPNIEPTRRTFADEAERLVDTDHRWWDTVRTGRFIESLSPLQAQRLERMRASRRLDWRTAYRRTRGGRAVWEIRADAVAGCLRTARGGSSKQAVVEAGRGRVRARWMTPREYARLQGAPDYQLGSGVRDNQAYFGFGDAVCVPVIAWIAQHYLMPALRTHGEQTTRSSS